MSEQLDIFSASDSTMSIVVWRAPTRKELRLRVKQADKGRIDTGSGADCTGQLCGCYAKMLRVYRFHHEWVGVVQIQVCFDV